VRIDYLELRDADELTEIAKVEKRAVMAVAAFLGTTRLIDNRVFSA
jgi:pantoate--beta-alanine ligase